ncbi:MAG: hypothetical protein NZ519_04150 [Bacteroidia bacterium]|nr:hypothetical protein [Bacteroidia bacterium]
MKECETKLREGHGACPSGQCVALAKHRSDSVVRNAPTLASARGTPKKIKS